MRPHPAPDGVRVVPRRCGAVGVALALLGALGAGPAAGGDETPPPAPAVPAADAGFLPPEPATAALGRLEDVVEVSATGGRVAAVLCDGGLRVGSAETLVAVASPPGGDGWLHVAVPARGPVVATTRRGYVFRVTMQGQASSVGRIQRGALPACSTTGADVVLATEGGAVYRVIGEDEGARLEEVWPSGAEPANAVAISRGRVLVARTTGVVERGPLAGPAERWLALPSPVTALALGDGPAALGDARGRLWVVPDDAGKAGEPSASPDLEVTALARLPDAPAPDDAPLRYVALEGGRRLRLYRASRAGAIRPGSAAFALEPGARSVIAADGDGVWLVGTDGRVRRVATAPAPASSPAAPSIPNAPR